jgi:hypothetical protein
MPMPSREGSNLRPLWRFRYALYKQKVTTRTPPPQKDVKNEGRSGKVYENKGSHDKMPDKKSDICARLNPVLQKNTDLEGQFAVSGILGACFEWRFIATRAHLGWSRHRRLSLRALRTAHSAALGSADRDVARCRDGTRLAAGEHVIRIMPHPGSWNPRPARNARKLSFSWFLSIMFKKIKSLTIYGRISQKLIQLNLKELFHGGTPQVPALCIML